MGPMLVLTGVVLLILATAGAAGSSPVAAHGRLKELRNPRRYVVLAGGAGAVALAAGLALVLR